MISKYDKAIISPMWQVSIMHSKNAVFVYFGENGSTSLINIIYSGETSVPLYGTFTTLNRAQWVEALNQYRKVASLNHNGHLVELRDLTSLRGSRWPSDRTWNDNSD